MENNLRFQFSPECSLHPSSGELLVISKKFSVIDRRRWLRKLTRRQAHKAITALDTRLIIIKYKVLQAKWLIQY